MSLQNATANMLARQGRPMVLRRRVGTGGAFQQVTLRGVLAGYTGTSDQGGLMQGDAKAVLDAATGALGGPKRGDLLVDAGRTWAVQGAVPRYVGERLVGWDVHVRGA
ncbi:MAG TPA: hypothetical protein VGN96_04005 [Roseococcus sp.]|jgi:hypothetical protein|nr:hypothetical protein [Roseococcus sp.]